MTPRRAALLLVAYLAFLAVVDLAAYFGGIPGSVRNIPMYDTLGHFGLIGLAALLLHWTLGRRVVRVLGLALPLGPLLIVVAAGAEEALQLVSSARQACLSDFAADVVGIAFFWALDTFCLRRNPAEQT